MAFSNPVNTVSSGETLVDGVLWGKQWSDGTPATTSLAVYIAGTSGNEAFDFGGQTVTARTVNKEVTAFQLAMQLIENVCNVDFVAVGSKSQADIIVGTVNNRDAGGSLGVAVPPGEDVGPLSSQQGAVIVNHAKYQTTDYSSLVRGGYDFISFVHELGHSIGLKHPHDRGGGVFPKFPGVSAAFDDYGDFNLNQGIYTMMSYNDGFPTGPQGVQDPATMPTFGWEGGPMAIDIAALQHLYGANTSFHTGNDVYTLPTANAAGTFYSCIWDAGGNDSIVAGAGAGNCTIDLRTATLKVANGGGGFVSSEDGIFGGFTIAAGVVIENATGGAGNDTLIGNKAANVLSGLGGADILNGGLGADTLWGGGGADTFVFDSVSDSTRSASDIIADFSGGDVIDLSGIDADGAGGTLDSFTFIAGRFDGGLGELRALYRGAADVTWILGDINGDKTADIRIVLPGNISINGLDFVL